MSILFQAKNEVLTFLSRQMPGVRVWAEDLEKPPNLEMGDIAFGCFGAAKAMGKSPALIAKDIAAAFKPTSLVSRTQAVGPYVNFYFDRAAFTEAAIEEILAAPENYGNTETKSGKSIMVEYGQPNTHKEFHVGHLRNLCLGISVVRMARTAGHTVIPVSYIGDVGAHVAKCLWALKKFHGGEPEPADKPAFLGKVYAEASQKAEENEDYKMEIAELQRALENGDPELMELWKKTRQWSLDEFNAIFSELGAEFERTYYESEAEKEGKRIVEDLLRQGIAEKSQGAIVVNLENEGLGFFLLLKSDGSALYSTKELALAQKKFSDFKVDASLHIVDTRQTLYFKQFFATLRRMGMTKEMRHLAYEFVTLPEGMISSRTGAVITYNDFRNELVGRAAEETKKRRADWGDEKIKKTAWAVAEAAMKFGMLKQDIERQIVFDIEAALSFDGFTGPYVQYSHARFSSILEKAKPASDQLQAASSLENAEYNVLRLAAEFPEVVVQAAEHYKPSLLAQYLFDLAKSANDFYRDVPVLAASEPDRARRLKIVEALRIVIGRGLYLLGITAPEEM